LTSRTLNSSLYEKLLPIERFQVAIDAVGRGDHDDLRRLTDSCPEHRYWAMDVNYGERLKAATVIALSAANMLFRARLALEAAIGDRERLEDTEAIREYFATTLSVDESSLEPDGWNELVNEIRAAYGTRAADLIGVCQGIRLFCQAIGVAPSNLLALERHCIPVWELGETLGKAHCCNEEMARAVHAYLTEMWSAMTPEPARKQSDVPG
jgi:hypothetical protein